ncbi:hypothetical protein MHBO_003554 [Bonamia ostreae]|uniref:Suppressor of forked domain-containing protein n=1 Tax=Bonamia ostreae TaxID=126728 RepID=A0ABV2AQT5_9EUKA
MNKIEEILREDKYNVDAWKMILKETSIPEISRKKYNAFLSVFPTAARFWKSYIEKEIAVKNYELVERLFKKCLFNCLDVDLWRSYINYIRIVKRGSTNELRDISSFYQFRHGLRVCDQKRRNGR